MEMRKTILFILLVMLSSLVLSGCSSKPGKYDSLAQCLTEKGAAMYGTEWCSHCKSQKNAFGSAFQYINYIDCDFNSDECLKNGITGYPTWIINGEKYPGEQPLFKLASLTDCKFGLNQTQQP